MFEDDSSAPRLPNTLASHLYTDRAAKRAKIIRARDIDTLFGLTNSNQITLIVRAILDVDLVSMVRADAGKRYRHALPVQEAQRAMMNSVHALLYTVHT